MEKAFQANGSEKENHQNKNWEAWHVSEQIDSETKTVLKDEEWHYIIIVIRGSIEQESRTILSTYPTLEHLNM